MKASHKETYSFALKALSTGDLACIDWPFGCGTDGYPTMRIDGKMVRLNRWVCEKAYALIAKDFGVDRSTVSQIKRRASWRHI